MTVLRIGLSYETAGRFVSFNHLFSFVWIIFQMQEMNLWPLILFFFTNINICFKIMLCDSCILDWFVILGTCVTNTEVVLSFDPCVCVCVESCERFAQKERERERGERRKKDRCSLSV